MIMATDYNNRLITPDLEKAMKDYPLYSQESTATYQPTKWQVWLWTHPSTDSVQSW